MEKESKFKCEACGSCCRGHGIPVTPLELYKIRDLITKKKLPYDKFWRFTKVLDPYPEREKDNRLFKLLDNNGELIYSTLVLLPKDEKEQECIFLNERTKRCDIYEARTFVCRDFPNQGHATETCLGLKKGSLDIEKHKQSMKDSLAAQTLYERQIKWWNNDENVPKEKKTIPNITKYLGLE